MDEKKVSIVTNYTFMVSGMTSMVLSAMMPYIISRAGIEYTRAGKLLAILSIGNMLATYISGYLINRFGKKCMAIIAAICSLLGMLIVFMLHSYSFLLIGFLLVGISRGEISNINNSLVNDYFSGNAKKLNMLHMFFSVGACIAPLVTSMLLGLKFYWAIVFTIFSLFNMGSILVYSGLPSTKENKVMLQEKKEYSFLKQPAFWAGAWILFFYIGIENSVNGWLVTYLTDAGLVSTEMAQMLLSLLYFIMVIGRIFGVRLGNKIKGTHLMHASSIGALLMYLCILSGKNGIILLVSVGLIGLFYAPMYPTTIASCSHTLCNNGVAMGTLLTIGGLGKVIMPYLVGKMADFQGIKAGMSVILGGNILLIVVILIYELLVIRKGEARV